MRESKSMLRRLKIQNPDLYNQIRNQAFEEAAKALETLDRSWTFQEIADWVRKMKSSN